MADSETKNGSISFKDTLNLPRTDFPIRATPKLDDPAMIIHWEKEELFTKSFECHKGAEKFILHDGPPYANGHLHAGHAYNKILKDIVTKSQRMLGKHVPVIPGWDCHGLPIELKVTQENPNLKGAALKKACRAYAQKWIDIQRQEFIKLGVLMDWDHYYSTMSYSYEAAILRAFAQFVAGGYIERKNKTVPWCPACQTVLAHAEIEYQDQKDPSVYVMFPLEESFIPKLFPNIANRPVNLLIWTTTPWTLPLNRAVLVKPNASYGVFDINNTLVLVAQELAPKIAAMMQADAKMLAECTGQQLVASGARAHHPFIDSLVPLILSDTVSLEDGTALVHCAPGCGPEDYEVGVRNNLEIFSPISPDGKYTAGIIPQELEGMPVTDGQIWVIKKLAATGKMFHKTTIKHSYPYCWRSHTPLIFRATKQWFCDLEKDNLKERAVAAADMINALPESSINRLKATLEGRLEWVLSRQRTWGTPIPALICTECDYTYSTPELINTVADEVAKKGIEYWDDATVDQLLPKNFSCPSCKKSSWSKEYDILDVWFESGISHYAVLYHNPSQAFPANMYLEGKDQHRAWFQSSLLTSMVLEKQPPMREIVTHGFTVDGQGRKMSKSLGNVVSPQEMIDQLGTDGLRLWASSIDISGEAVISPLLLDNVKEVFRKIRNTSRFLLSNLYDFDVTQDKVPLEKMLVIDAYALRKLEAVNFQVKQLYEKYDFTAVAHLLGNYCASELSSFYLDIIKDRLYVEKADGPLRRSAQTTCWYVLDTMTRLVAPILSITAEQISDYYQKNKTESIHLQEFAHLIEVSEHRKKENFKWDQNFEEYTNDNFDIRVLKKIRDGVLKAIEGLREKGIVKHSLEAKVIMHVDANAPFAQQFTNFIKDLEKRAQTVTGFFEEFFIVSQVELRSTAQGLEKSEYSGLFVAVEKAPGQKCPRCWQWKPEVHDNSLCNRCTAIVK